MEKSKMIELAERLLSSTRARKLTWREGVKKNSYAVDFPDMSLSIENFRGDFTLELINDKGAVIETLSPIGSDPDRDKLREIYDIARRQVLDIDGTIDKAIEYLGSGLQ